MKIQDYLRFEEEYWKPISGSDGKLLDSCDGNWIKQELFDYYMLMVRSSQVYGAITGGKIRDTRSEPDVVINCASSMIADQMHQLTEEYEAILEQEFNEREKR